MIFFDYISERKFFVLLFIEFILIIILTTLNIKLYQPWFCSSFSIGCPSRDKSGAVTPAKSKDNISLLVGVIKKMEDNFIILLPENTTNKNQEIKAILNPETKFAIRPLYIFPEKGDQLVSTNSSALKVGQKIELFAKLEKESIIASLITIFSEEKNKQ